MIEPKYDVVVPTLGRPSLRVLLERLAGLDLPGLTEVVVVVDRPGSAPPDVPWAGVRFLRGRGAGPATARNLGWRAGRSPWVVFLDDDVVPGEEWGTLLQHDLQAAGPEVAGVQGRLRVPLPPYRRPTDWERNVHGLERARWATADMAYRREVLEGVGGFDERFPRAYREDADIALRVLGAGYRLVVGSRTTIHPVRPAGLWISVRLQAGNADDVAMRALHGPGWRTAASVPKGRLRWHLVTAASLVLGMARVAAGRRGRAAVAFGAWAALTADFARRRIAAGPRTPGEVVTMLITSVAIPIAASAASVRGLVRIPRLLRTPTPGGEGRPAAVLFDRDGTLVIDVPYNGDPSLVRPAAGARRAVTRLREAGVRLGVVTNQSGVARRLLTEEQVHAVNRRIEGLLGPLGPWLVCPHGPAEGCDCRKPAPGLVLDAARRLGVRPEDCVVIGDTGADVEAALAAGARPILIPTKATRREEVEAAPEVAGDLLEAVDRILGVAS